MCCFRQRTTWGKPWLDCFLWPSVPSQLREAGKNRESHACYGLGRGLQFAAHTTVHFSHRRATMQTYVSLVKFTQHGLQTMKDKGIERAEMVKQTAKSLGGKLVQAYYCLGEYDVVAIWEFPDNKTAMKAAVLNASLGHIQITTLPAGNREEWKGLLQQSLGKKR